MIVEMAANAEPTLMDDIMPKLIQNLKEMFLFDNDPNSDNSEVKRLLRLIKDTNSLLAGGFLLHSLHDEMNHNDRTEPSSVRSIYASRPDIDIYVPMEHAYQFMQEFVYGYDEYKRGSILNVYNPKVKFFKSTLYCQSFLRKNGIQAIYNVIVDAGDDNYRANYERFEFDIMIVRSWRTPLQVVNNFDLTFCQIWFDGEHVYTSHPEDVRNKKGTLQGEYVNLFVQGNMFLQNRIQKYRTRGYEIRIDPVLLREIGRNPMTIMPICEEESREDIMTHWTSRVMLYWLLGVRDEVIRPIQPVTPSITTDDILIVPLLLHDRPNPMGNSGDYFIQAHRQREVHNKNTVENITGYDSEDYEDETTMYHLLKNYDEEWDETQQLLEFYRETNRLIEMISWPNLYKIQFKDGSRRYPDNHKTGYCETMGLIFDYPHNDSRKEYFLPFYYALRDRCIRKSHYFYDENEPTIENIMLDDFTNMTDLYEVYDIHEHPLTGAATYEYIQKYLREYMTQEDKSEVPCYYPGCDKPLTLSQVKYIVKPDFYNEYKPPAPYVSQFPDQLHIDDEKEEPVANAVNAANAERLHQISQRWRRLVGEVNDIIENWEGDDGVDDINAIADALHAIEEIEGGLPAGVQNLDDYEDEVYRIEEMFTVFKAAHELNANLPNVAQGGRFNRSRKKQPRRKQKTLRNLLKKLK